MRFPREGERMRTCEGEWEILFAVATFSSSALASLCRLRRDRSHSRKPEYTPQYAAANLQVPSSICFGVSEMCRADPIMPKHGKRNGGGEGRKAKRWCPHPVCLKMSGSTAFANAWDWVTMNIKKEQRAHCIPKCAPANELLAI
jgi:hypothetical protein